jgi:diguanylate cyclase (GGDEF)-like protein
MMDLDGFKAVNDEYGHETGDKLLKEVSLRLQSAMRIGDTVARLGGDEFVLLLTDVEDIHDIGYTLERIISVVSAPCELEGHQLKVSASVGVTVYPFDEADSDALLRHADHAMYQVKEHGRQHYRLFDTALAHQDTARQLHFESIRFGLINKEFILYYQPKVDMRESKIVGLEALLRWNHPERGMIGPLEFLPMVEQTDLEILIGQWVLREALQQIAFWHKKNRQFKVSVNISARHLLQPDFISHLKMLINNHPEVNPALLELEILESAALNDLQAARSVILECQAIGVTVAIDDFGTGYSSLAYIKNLPANVIKIDQSFVRDMLHDHEDHALVEAVIKLSHLFSKQVIAEGVETMMHGVRLMSLGCDLAQGYGIARPMPAKDLMGWIATYESGSVWVC